MSSRVRQSSRRMRFTLSAKGLTVLILITFAAGTVAGFQLKSWHIKWLKKRRQELKREIRDIDNRLH